MKNVYYAVVALVLSALCAEGRANIVINFDPSGTPGDLPATLSAMGNSPGSAVPSSAQLSNQYEADGVLFGSSSPYVAVVDNGGSSASPPNAIGGVTSDGLLSYADPVTFTFVVPGTTTPGVTTNFSIEADAIGIPGQFATVNAFDINNQLLDSVVLEDTGSEVWSINLPGIHSAVFEFPTTSGGTPTTGSAFGSGTGIALDNLTFGPVTSATSGTTGTPSAVPLPPMVWEGFFVIGALVLVRRFRLQNRKTA